MDRAGARRALKKLALIAVVSGGFAIGPVAIADAHQLTVTPPGQDEPVIVRQDLATGTPRHFPDGSDPGTGPDSAASQGTNVACEAVHATNSVVDMDGGSCSPP